MIEARERLVCWWVGAGKALFCGDVASQLFCVAGVVLLSFALARAQGGGTVLELMQQATTAQRNGDTSTAIQLYRKVLQQRPHWGPAEYNLGLAHVVEKDYAAAIKLFDLALNDAPTLVGAYLFRGIAYYNLGDARQAVSSLKRYAGLQPQDVQVHEYLAGSYFALRDYPEAAAQYLLELRSNPSSEDAYYYLGHCYIAMATDATKVLSEGPEGRYYARLVLGEREGEEGNPAAALQNIRQAIRLNPVLPDAYIDFGNLLLAARAPEKATAEFEQALKRDSQNCSAREGLGDAELAAGNLLAALAHYRSALHSNSACVLRPALQGLGLPPDEFAARLKSLAIYKASHPPAPAAEIALVRLMYGINGSVGSGKSKLAPGVGKPAGCAVLMSKTAVHSPVNANLFLASCKELAGDVDGATSALISADRGTHLDQKAAYEMVDIEMRLSQRVLAELARVSPNSYLLAEMRAEWFELRGKYPEADAEYRKATTFSGDDPNPLIEYATFECKLNHVDQARPILEKALNIVPYNAVANSLLGYVYFTKNDFKVAVPYLRTALNGRPTDEQSRIYLAESLSNLHDLPGAVAILESAPSDPDGRIHYVLAGYYRELGRKEQMEAALAFFSERQRLLHDRPNAR